MFDTLISFTEWLFFTSLKATVVVALILLVQRLFSRHLAAKWQHALWFLLIVRLLLPFDIPLSISIFNLTQNMDARLSTFKFETTEISKSTQSDDPVDKSFSGYAPIIKSDVHIIPTARITFVQVAAAVWLLFAAGLFAYTLGLNIALWRRISTAAIVTHPAILDILHRCQHRLGINNKIHLLSMTDISSPFWFGVIKRRILCPAELLRKMSSENLEHVFMHELVHYKQKDVPLALLATALQILHWFNPFIWLAFFKMRADRELACDELVLTNIGTDKNKQYGRTLISLIESASQRGLLPVAVGLADTKFNLKRRVTMIANFSKKSLWWTAAALLLISTIATLALTNAQNAATISGRITFQGGEQPDSLHIGVYRLMPHDWVRIDYIGEPFQFLTQAKTAYSFDVEPGCYTIAAWAFGYERAFAEIIVPDEKSRININFDLAAKSLPGPVTGVKIIGDFCEWDNQRAPTLDKIGSIWQFSNSTALQTGSLFKFLVSGVRQNVKTAEPEEYVDLFRYYPGDASTQIVKDYATFNHRYAGQTITFDPAEYKISDGKATITVKGFDLYHQFAALQDSLRLFEIYYHDVRNQYGNQNVPPEETKQAFSTLKARFERLEKEFDPFFADIFHEYWLDNLLGFAPSLVDLQQLAKNGVPDSAQVENFLDTSSFIPYNRSIVDRIKHVDPRSILIDGGLWEGVHWIQMFGDFVPNFYNRLGINENFAFDFVVDFCKKTSNNQAKEKLLYHFANAYASEEPYDLEKAGFLIEWLYRDVPDSWYISNAGAENIRNRLKLREGLPAPLFVVTTLNGERIQLADLNGKFVFLEFWGSNCGPCRGESPNMIKLSQSISPDSLILLGFGDADEKKARAFAQDEKLTYPNAVAPEHVLKDYGITYYPATYLIDPQGNIIGKDMRGKNLLNEVRAKMRMYAAK